MKISITSNSAFDISTDLLAVGVTTDLAESIKAVEGEFAEQLLSWATDRKFKGNAGSSLVVPTFGQLNAKTLMLVGIGDGKPADVNQAAAMVGKEARSKEASSVVTMLPGEASMIAQWVSAGNYKYEPYKPADFKTTQIETLTICGDQSNADLQRATTLIKHQSACRDLVNAPPADLYPETLAAYALGLSKFDGVTVEILDTAACEKAGYIGLLAVAQGSSKPGCMIHITYRPKNSRAHIGLVGKGVTYDSGGLSLKPSTGQQTMRCDMGGAAVMLGTVGAAAELQLPVSMDVVVGAVENMCAANSYKLGDILSYSNGVTVEIHNTDAEGRLVLADCLIRASGVEGLTHLIDAATLTGACALAVGADFTGMFTKSDEFAAALTNAANVAGEGLWRLPLHDPYKKSLKAQWAQIKNLGDREGGASNAASFLEHFVAEDIEWTHLDIAGSAFHEKASDRYCTGATGEMVRTLVNWIEGL